MYKRIVDDSWSFKTANTKEFTHYYHTYPAMMIPQVARPLIESYAPEGKLELLSNDVLLKLSFITQVIKSFDDDVQLFSKLHFLK